MRCSTCQEANLPGALFRRDGQTDDAPRHELERVCDLYRGMVPDPTPSASWQVES